MKKLNIPTLVILGVSVFCISEKHIEMALVIQRMERNLNTKSLVVLVMAPRKQKTVESGGIGLMSDGGEAHSVPFPIWRKFINRLALAALAHCNDNVNDDGNLRIGHSEKYY